MGRPIQSNVTTPAQPFLKWAGGKAALAPRITALFPKDARERVYREPFVGGGAMFFHLQPERAHLSDALADLVATYVTVQTNVDPLIKRLETLLSSHSDEQYYALRDRFNTEKDASRLERAAWLLYLNKTCYNGLFRTNKGGEFNVPVGRFKSPRVTEPDKLRLAAAVLGNAEIEHQPFEHLLDVAEADDLVYLDPPYVPISKTSSFAGYSDGAFGSADQTRLADVFRALDERGCLLALSNSDTPIVRELYRGYDLSPVIATRLIGSKAATRGETTELLVRNLARYPRA